MSSKESSAIRYESSSTATSMTMAATRPLMMLFRAEANVRRVLMMLSPRWDIRVLARVWAKKVTDRSRMRVKILACRLKTRFLLT